MVLNVPDSIFTYVLQLYHAVMFCYLRCDGVFIDHLRQYISSDAGKDAAVAADEGKDMQFLKQLLNEAARDLDRCTIFCFIFICNL